jgi:hypothetical protein
MRITCPDCHGSCVEKTGRRVQDTQHTYTDETVACTGCSGRGWVDHATGEVQHPVGDTTVLPPSPTPDEQTYNGGVKKPRQAEGWLLAVGALILLGLLGHVLNQQRSSRQTPDTDDVERRQRESAPVPAPETPPSDATRRNDAGDPKPSAAPMRVVYMVRHEHRLRDCHGSLTFTRQGLRFDSDEPEDSFDVALDDVTIEGDVLHLRNKPWRFEFDDGVRAERVFQDWKAGILRSVSAP